MYKRITILGCPGAGKSHLSKELSKILNYPLYHLDKIFWHENWVESTFEEFVKIQEQICKEDCWIIEGNYNKTVEVRIKRADLIIMLDFPKELCLKRIMSRPGKRDDMPDSLIETDENKKEFYQYVKDFSLESSYKKLEGYQGKLVVLKSPEEKETYLKSIEREMEL